MAIISLHRCQHRTDKILVVPGTCVCVCPNSTVLFITINTVINPPVSSLNPSVISCQEFKNVFTTKSWTLDPPTPSSIRISAGNLTTQQTSQVSKTLLVTFQALHGLLLPISRTSSPLIMLAGPPSVLLSPDDTSRPTFSPPLP